jgi:hypothetical protein
MVMVFSLKSRTAPILCKVCLPMIRSYKGDGVPILYSTISGVSHTDLLAEYSIKEMSIVPTFLSERCRWMCPLIVAQPSSQLVCTFATLFYEKEVTTQSCVKQYPYSFFFTICLLLTLLTGSLSPFRCLLD